MGDLIGLYALVFFGFACVALVVGASLSWIYVHLAIAAVGIAYWASTSMSQFRERVARGSSRRTARYGANVLVQTVIVTAKSSVVKRYGDTGSVLEVEDGMMRSRAERV